MAMVKVYRVTVFNKDTNVWEDQLSRRMATLEGAKAIGGKVIENTEIEIDDSLLERGEQYTPIDFQP